MNAVVTERVITGYSPIANGMGWLGPLINLTAQTTGMVFQQRMASDAATRARHERARELQAEADRRAAEIAHIKATQEALAATQATGAPIALNAAGQPISASGVVAGGVPGMLRGKSGLMVVGIAGVAIVGAFMLMRRGR